MQFEYTPFVLPLIIAASISGGIAYYAWRRQSTSGARALSILALAITFWLIGYTLEITGANLETKLFWGKSQYIAITLIPVFWLIFAIYQSDRRKALTNRQYAQLVILPAATMLLAFTTERHGLIWSEVGVSQSGDFSALDVSYGPWFWVHSAYSYLLLLAGTVLVLRKIRGRQQLYRRQAAALTLGVAAPWIGNIIYLAGLSPIPGLDLTPFAFTLTVVALALGIFSFRIMELLPVARDLIVEEMHEGMIVLDANHRIADINPSAEKMFDLTVEQAIGAPAGVAFSRWPHFIKKFGNVLEAVEEITVGEGEDRRWYELSLSPLFDHRKRYLGRVIMIRDITSRRQAEEQVRRLSRAVESSPASIVITDTQGNIQYVNPKFVQVTGYSLDEVIGHNPRFLKTDETPPEVHRQLWETITAGKEWRGEFCNRKKNGEQFWESASISPISDHTGQVVSYVAVKEDITEQRRLQQQLLRQQEALKTAHDQAVEASQMKTQLLAKVNHELRTPLGGILGYAELLHSGMLGDLSEKQHKAAAQIIDSSNYLSTLINELLDAAQIESRRLSLHLQDCSLAVLLGKVTASMSVLATKKNLKLKTYLAANLPKTIIADEQRLQQILINLVGNAIKYTKKGWVQVNLYRPDPSHWAIKVTDTGVGIPEEHLGDIFEPFRQVNPALTSDNQGTGLGLAITQQLVSLMGGQITVESTVGTGTTFTVILPLENEFLPAHDPRQKVRLS